LTTVLDFTAALTGSLAAEALGFFTAGFSVLTGWADAFTALAAGLALPEALAAALGTVLALAATLGAAFLASTFTDDLLDVFTSSLLAVQLTRTLCASPSQRTQGARLHQNPQGKPFGAVGPIRHPVRAAIVATGQVKSEIWRY
jgi:hypothetical protein